MNALTPTPTAVDTRPPPHNFEMEMGLIAALMASNRAYDRIADITSTTHFADARHGRIFEAIAKLIERGQQANAATLRAYFQNDADLADIGGVAYLAKLQASAVTIVNVKDYAETLRDLWMRRELLGLAEDVRQEAHRFEIGHRADAVVEEVEQALHDLVERGDARGGPVALAAACDQAMNRAEAASKGEFQGLRTGLAALDEKLGGLEPGTLTVLGGRPSMGKTAAGVVMALHAARNGAGVAFFSLEMPAAQIARRAQCQIAGVPLEAMRAGRLGPEAWSALQAARESFAQLPFAIDDRPALSLGQIAATARRLKRKKRLGLIVVDHLTLMGTPRGLEAKKVEAVGHNSGGLKRLAKELEVPVLCLCQLSRANEQREEKRPQLSDLRWSGEIEQDADIVIFVHREHYYLSRAEPTRSLKEKENDYLDRRLRWQDALVETAGKAELIVAKNRDGGDGVVRVAFDGPTAKFSDLDSPEEQP
ncbi:MAG: AAA family ATPase [Azospirillum sp.]|nr:AAA family ATPase [Azospirillum sp.]